MVFDSATIQAKSFNLTTAAHLWILPAYFNPYWWRKPTQDDMSCTDEEMLSILQSTIFVDPVKFPPFVSIRLSDWLLTLSDWLFTPSDWLLTSFTIIITYMDLKGQSWSYFITAGLNFI